MKSTNSKPVVKKTVSTKSSTSKISKPASSKVDIKSSATTKPKTTTTDKQKPATVNKSILTKTVTKTSTTKKSTTTKANIVNNQNLKKITAENKPMVTSKQNQNVNKTVTENKTSFDKHMTINKPSKKAIKAKQFYEKIGFDKTKFYTISEAVSFAKKLSKTKFVSSIDLAIKLNLDTSKSEQQLRGTITLPYHFGKSKKILVLDKGLTSKDANKLGVDFAGDSELIAEISKG